MKKILLVLMSTLLLNACGFKLASKAILDPMFEKTNVTYQANGRVMADLVVSQFKVNDIEMVDAADANALLTILYEATNNEILSVDENGKVREYELILRVAMKLEDNAGKIIINNQNIRLSRDFLFDINDVLGKASEREQIYQEMREDIARLIVYRLEAISSIEAQE